MKSEILIKSLLLFGLFFLLIIQIIHKNLSPICIGILSTILFIYGLFCIKYKKKIENKIVAIFSICGLYNLLLIDPFLFLVPHALLLLFVFWFLIYYVSKLYYTRNIWFMFFIIFNYSAPFWVIRLNYWKNINSPQSIFGTLFYQIGVFIFLTFILSKPILIQGENQ